MSNFAWLNELKNIDLTHTRYGQYGEDLIIDHIFEKLGTTNKFFVDIGAGDYGNAEMSNTKQLILHGWNGLSFDADDHGKENIIKEFVTPFNIVPLLDKHKCHTLFDFLNIDIDSFDYDVLESVLKGYRPNLICVEYNATLPVNSTIKLAYEEGYFWKDSNKYGFSFGAGMHLFKNYGYTVVMNHVNSNLFAICNSLLPKELHNNIEIQAAQQTMYHAINNEAVWVDADEKL